MPAQQSCRSPGRGPSVRGKSPQGVALNSAFSWLLSLPLVSLDEDFSESEAEKQFQTVAHWIRCAQHLGSDAGEQQLHRVEEENVEEIGD